MTSTDDTLVQASKQPTYEVVPYTGEAVVLRDLSFAQLGELLDSCRDWERSQLSAFKRSVQDEVLARMDSRAEWTVRDEGGWKLSGDSPDRTEFDMRELKAALSELVAGGVLDADAAQKAIRLKVVEEPSVAGLKALRKLGGRVRDAIDACEHPSGRPRAVRVTREVQL